MTGPRGQPPSGAAHRFDYFGDRPKHGASSAAYEDAAQSDAVAQPANKRRWSSSFKLFFLACCTWFAWQYHDLALYSLQPFGAPAELGAVTEFTPELVPHNAYVCVEGISEHRGMTQAVSRVLGQNAKPYWYFRLLGSRGIFVEVAPDSERYGTTQAMRVCGRAVDPTRSPTFEQLIAAYESLFATEVTGPTRIIEGDMLPGAHRERYMAALVGLVAAFGAQAWALWRRWR